MRPTSLTIARTIGSSSIRLLSALLDALGATFRDQYARIPVR
jgi:hypothetical protein